MPLSLPFRSCICYVESKFDFDIGYERRGVSYESGTILSQRVVW